MNGPTGQPAPTLPPNPAQTAAGGAEPAEPGKTAARAAGIASGGRWSWAGPLAVVSLVAPALWPLLRAGFFVSDDGLFHVYRIAALASAWQHGVLYPRLFPEFGFGYGQAVLNFYAPLAYAPGALLAVLGLSPATAAELTIALGFVLAALAIYGYTRSLWEPAAAGPRGVLAGALAAIVYSYFPYHLADAYVRGAIPEHFAFIWPPLILWAYTSAFRRARPGRSLLLGALAWAALAYTHNLTALLMTAPWAVYVAIMAGWTKRWRRLIPACGSAVLAVALSAPLWLPFLAESRYVGLALGPSDGYRQHLASLGQAVQRLPFYQYRQSQGGPADHPLSWLAALLFLVILALLIGRLAARRPLTGLPVAAFGLVTAAASAFMITAPSLPAWQALEPLLANLQYPWRFLVLTTLGLATAVGALPSLAANETTPSCAGASEPGRRSRWSLFRTGAFAVLLLMLIFQPLLTTPSRPLTITAAEAWTPDRMWREDAEAGQVGATWTAEFLPLTVQEQRWALGRPAKDAQDSPALSPRSSVHIERIGYDQIELRLETARPVTFRLHQFHLPIWQSYVNGRHTPNFPTGDLGLVSTDVAQGASRLVFRFGPTPAWAAGSALGVLAVGVWVYLAWRIQRGDRLQMAGRNHRDAVLAWAGWGLIALAVGLGLNGLGVGQRTWTPQPAQTAVGDIALLVASDVVPTRAAEALDVTLYWFALRETSSNYKTFVHLVGPDGRMLAQHDGDPVGGYTPTTRWLSGELIADRHRIPWPRDLAAGEYRLKAGIYQPEPLVNLAADPPTADGRIDLGVVRSP